LEIVAEPRGVASLVLVVESFIEDEHRAPALIDPIAHDAADEEHAAWTARRTHLRCDLPRVELAFRTAAEDLFSLRREDATADAFVPNAGVPAYTGLFGRDALTAAWQGALLGPEMLRGVLAVLADRTGTRDDAFHDEEPDKILHEARTGPLSVLGVVPQAAYFGTVTSPSLFATVLRAAHRWTGDASLLKRYLPVARRALSWMLLRGDSDGDGLVEYQTRSARGLANQGWKDSGEAIRHADGSLAQAPLAVIDTQANLVEALDALAELFTAAKDHDGARWATTAATSLRAHIEEKLWLQSEGTYAVGLDRDKRLVQSVASNAVHALAAGVCGLERARRVVARLLADDMYSGFGLRTLSARHPSYNPYGYHLGCVWPVESATLVRALRRYGFDDEAKRVAADLFLSAEAFPDSRLPELFSGHARGAARAPSTFPRACSPQAWSASAIIAVVESLLGVEPDAAHGVLRVSRPMLPEGVAQLALRGLRVGGGSVSLRFTARDGLGCDVEVTAKNGIEVVIVDGAVRRNG
jgi:glycogen debranching enzyme